MGKIRIKTLGDEELEKEQEKKAKKRQENKKTVKAPGLKGGERVVAVGPSEEEIAKIEIPEVELKESPKEAKKDKKKKKKTPARERSMRYKSAKILSDKGKIYSLSEALDILPQMATKSFDETVELHLNTAETGISGNFTLPHGSGKKTKVAIADDKIILDVEKGKIEFDVLIASPEFMPKLARVARFLGPRGLMPNPKNGTMTKNPEEAVKKYEGGLVNFKTEAKSPIIHLSVGKISFGKEKLSENIKTALKAMPAGKIKKVVLKSTMSPSLKIDFVKV